MNREELLEALKIRYVDLEVTLLFPESASVPRYKVSALRGGMGQVLLGQHCIRDENCEACDFAAECLIQRTLYSQYEIQPPFARKGNSIGYVIECGDSREQIPADGTMIFHLLLFGKTHCPCLRIPAGVLLAGEKGTGKDAARYEILNVSGSRGKSLIRNGAFCAQNLEIDQIGNYVLEREQQLLRKKGKSFIIRFLTPVTLKYRGAFIREFTKEAVLESVMRRIYSFNCFEGRKMESAGLKKKPLQSRNRIAGQGKKSDILPEPDSRCICGEAAERSTAERSARPPCWPCWQGKRPTLGKTQASGLENM